MTGTLNRGVIRPYNGSTGVMELIPYGSYPLQLTRPKLMTQLDCNSQVLKDLKNLAASALSGTQRDIEIDIGGVPYYFTVYPTKA